MPLTLAFIMDPIEHISVGTDTSFAFMLAAFKRGHRIVHVAPHEVSLENDRPLMRGRQLEVYSGQGSHFRQVQILRLPVDGCDAVFIRKDPPFDTDYLAVTWMLSLAENTNVTFINSPSGIRSANEKLYALNFPTWCPVTLVTALPDEIRAFVAAHQGQAIAKPLDGHAGFGVVRLRADDSNMHALIDLLTHEGRRSIVVQEFLTASALGDKRLLLMDGMLYGAVRRVPCPGDHRGNLHAGAHAEACEVTPADHALACAMRDRLRSDGLFFVGVDVIGDKLIEVNVTSPTLVQELRTLTGLDLARALVDALEEKSGSPSN